MTPPTSACTDGQSSRPRCGLRLHRALTSRIDTLSPGSIGSPPADTLNAPMAVKAGVEAVAVSERSNAHFPSPPSKRTVTLNVCGRLGGYIE